jgi:Cu/Ag efflux protein CusF
MFKRIAPLLTVCLIAATAAHAQSGGGHGRGGRGGGSSPDSSAPASPPEAAPPPRQTPMDQIEITGVVKAIDLDAGRITIAYDAVEALNWPAGSMPFGVTQTALLKSASVGEKVRFKLESQEISDLRPF